MRKEHGRPGEAWAAALFWLGLWEVLSLRVNRALLLPGPREVLERLLVLAASALFWRTVGISLLRITCGVLAAALLGTLLAALSCRFRFAAVLLSPPLAAVKATPVASFIILALLWMGRDPLPGFISALVVLPVVYANVSAGIAALDPALLEVARVYRLSRGRLLTKVYVPAVLPWFVSALRSSLGMGWKAGVAAEVLTVPAVSIGRRLYESKLYLETEDLFAWTAAVVLLSLGLERLLTALAERLLSGGAPARHGGGADI